MSAKKGIICLVCKHDGHSSTACPELANPLKDGFYTGGGGGGGSHSHDDDEEDAAFTSIISAFLNRTPVRASNQSWCVTMAMRSSPALLAFSQIVV